MTVPLALLGPRTGTNNPVSSGAHFGVSGRLIGSLLTLAFALAFAAIACGPGATRWWRRPRLLGTPDGDGALAVGYLVIAAGSWPSPSTATAPSSPCRRIVVPLVGLA